jgi:hypothetical protein
MAAVTAQATSIGDYISHSDITAAVGRELGRQEADAEINHLTT